MYRPPEWEKIRVKVTELTSYVGNESYIEIFEAGADAILEALLKSNEPNCEVFVSTVRGMDGKESSPIKAYGKQYPGKLVFIPEEE